MSEHPTAAVLIIGNEILSGKTQDANLKFLGLAFGRLGITLREARVVRDEHDVIADVVNDLRARHTYVFTTGGIGPTHDDITAESIAQAFGVPLVVDEEAKRRISAGGRELTPARMKMAMVPEGASLIDNPVSQAPGFRIENVFVMAGIPAIAVAMFESIEKDLVGGEPILSASVDLHAREGDFAAGLLEIANRYADVEIGSYPFFRDGTYGASIVVRGRNQASVDAAIGDVKSEFGKGD